MSSDPAPPIEKKGEDTLLVDLLTSLFSKLESKLDQNKTEWKRVESKLDENKTEWKRVESKLDAIGQVLDEHTKKFKGLAGTVGHLNEVLLRQEATRMFGEAFSKNFKVRSLW